MQLVTASNGCDHEKQKKEIMDQREVLISALYRIMEDAAVGDDLCDLCPEIQVCRKKGSKRCLQIVAGNL